MTYEADVQGAAKAVVSGCMGERVCLLPPELSLLALHRRVAGEGFSEELPRFDWRGIVLLYKGEAQPAMGSSLFLGRWSWAEKVR